MKEKAKQWLFFCYGIGATLAVVGSVVALRQEPSHAPQASTTVAQDEARGELASPQPTRSQVELSASQTAAINLQVASITRQDVSEELRVVATVVPDESRISHIHTRVTGWVEKLYVGNTGEFVKAGQPIVDIFSQELFVSQVEYLSSRALSGPPTAVVESGRARLRFFGMSESAIEAIEKTGKPHRLVTLSAPRSGILAHRGIFAGTAVDPSTEIATVLDLSRIWVWAEVPESAAASVRKGMTARLEFGAAGDRSMPATVEFIDPILTETTRKLRVRFSLPNAKGELRPGTYGTAVFQSPTRLALTVPRDALVDTGDAQYVYVLKDESTYEPRAVRPGARLKDRIEIVEGLRAQDKVVVSGVFLLDSESRLRASGGGGAAHGGHARPASSVPPAQPSAPAHAQGRAGHD